MKKLLVLSLALTIGIATALVINSFMVKEQKQVQVSAQWKDVYRTLGGLVAGADLIVVADHLIAEPGRTIGEGEDTIPFTNNTFTVKSILKGTHNGSTLLVEQTGGMLSNGMVLGVNDGGQYIPGSSYLLFLKDNGDGNYYVINHQARYQIKDNILEGVDPTDLVVARMHGVALERSNQMIKSRVRLIE
ncbi:MAG: hypothetical protein AB1489_34110 [Acidobacteriota bacterium]